MADKANYKLKPTTPRALRVLKEHGLINEDNRVVIKNQLTLFMDVGNLKTVCEACFHDDFKNVDFDELDLEPVAKGLADFLLNALGGSRN